MFMKDKKSPVIALFVFACIFVNCAGKWVANTYNLPIWLDSVGTILVAYLCGPICGAMVGTSVNIIFSFSNPMSIIYALTSIAVALLVGVCARKNFFRNFFGTMSVSFLVSLVSVAISTPLNYYFNGGYTGNIWGDGVIDFLLEHNINTALSCLAGEFYVDFLDKTLILVWLFLRGRLFRRLHGRRSHGAAALTMLALCLLLGGSILPITASAAEDGGMNYSTYVQTVYDGESGLTTGTATSIA